jgi:transglutaminase-like putative cysteine protease
MKSRIERTTSQQVATNLGGALLSAALTLAALGVAIWALESADWVDPRPSFLFALLLGVAGGTALGRTKLGWLAVFPLIIVGGLGVAAWRTFVLFVPIEGLSTWSRWVEAITMPSNNPIAFIAFLLFLSWLAGAIGAWYAVRRANGWPAFIFGALIVIFNLINLPRDFAYVLPANLALGLALVVQTGWRRTGDVPEGSSRRTPVVAGMILCLLVVLGAFILPQSPAERFSLNIDGGALYATIKKNGMNIFSSVPSKVKTVRSSGQESVSFQGAVDQSNDIRFIVGSTTQGYFRTRYYDLYSAAGWSNSSLADTGLASGQTIADASPLSKATIIKYEIENAVKTDLILINGQGASLSIPVTVRSLPAPTGTDIMALISPKLLNPYQPYTVTAYLPAVTAEDLMKSGADYPDWIKDRYLQLPAGLPRSVTQFSRLLTRGLVYGGQDIVVADSAYAKVLAIKTYLQGLTYNINGTTVPGGVDGVAQLLASKQGNCVNFASAMVVMLRSVGVPARFVQGYLGTELDAENKNLVIRGKDAHAWAEVYFPEYGWIIVEATPGRPADRFSATATVAPGPIEPPGTSAAPVIPGSEITEEPMTNPTTGASDNPISSAPLLATLLALLGGMVIVLGGGTLYLTRASQPEAAYARLGWIGKSFRIPLKAADTPAEYARRLGARLPGEAKDISVIATTFARSRYSPVKTTDKQAQAELSRAWRSLSLKLIRRRLEVTDS